jgi:LmbE family N-acetylglucosaminyl deacetylase
MNPYHSFVSSFARLIGEGKSLPLGGVPIPSRPSPSADAPVALIFSPHPDDECVVGGLALRLMREARMRVVNVAVTQGSNRERQQPRLHELQQACAWIGFQLEQTAPKGLERISPKTRASDSQHWTVAVKTIASLLAKHRPRVIFFPHELDWNSTHIGTHFLVMDALALLPETFQTLLVETEYWGQMASPNLMAELSTDHVADLLAALSCHAGEVTRNAFHLRLPAWMQDNVRRGAELVGGQGGAAPHFIFATLYRVRAWKDRRTAEVFTAGKFVPCVQNVGEVFGWSC